MPQPPQLLGSALVAISQPSAGNPLQFAKPVLHEPKEHTPPEHTPLALGYEQTVPHALQLDALVLRLTSQPLLTIPSQLPKPELQEAIVQAPPLQPGVALAYGPQTLPHEPQLVTSL